MSIGPGGFADPVFRVDAEFPSQFERRRRAFADIGQGATSGLDSLLRSLEILRQREFEQKQFDAKAKVQASQFEEVQEFRESEADLAQRRFEIEQERLKGAARSAEDAQNKRHFSDLMFKKTQGIADAVRKESEFSRTLPIRKLDAESRAARAKTAQQESERRVLADKQRNSLRVARASSAIGSSPDSTAGTSWARKAASRKRYGASCAPRAGGANPRRAGGSDAGTQGCAAGKARTARYQGRRTMIVSERCDDGRMDRPRILRGACLVWSIVHQYRRMKNEEAKACADEYERAMECLRSCLSCTLEEEEATISAINAEGRVEDGTPKAESRDQVITNLANIAAVAIVLKLEGHVEEGASVVQLCNDQAAMAKLSAEEEDELLRRAAHYVDADPTRAVDVVQLQRAFRLSLPDDHPKA